MKVPLMVRERSCQNCNMFDNSIFSILSDTQVIDLNAHKYCTVFRKGQVLFAENAMPVGLFCIHSGKVKLSTQGIDGKEQIMRLAKSCEIIGYRALVSNERYHLSAIALEDCSACVIDKTFFMDLAMQEPRMKMITETIEPQYFDRKIRQIRTQVSTVLNKWGLLPRFKRWRLAQDPDTGMIVLFGILNNGYIARHTTIPFGNYFDPRLFHDLANEMQLQVVSCNSDGLRYAFILDRGQLGKLPTHIDYPFIDNGKLSILHPYLLYLLFAQYFAPIFFNNAGH